MKKLEEVVERFGFNTDWLDELQESGEAKLSMQFDNTPALMKAINDETDFQAVLSADTDSIIVSKY